MHRCCELVLHLISSPLAKSRLLRCHRLSARLGSELATLVCSCLSADCSFVWAELSAVQTRSSAFAEEAVAAVVGLRPWAAVAERRLVVVVTWRLHRSTEIGSPA